MQKIPLVLAAAFIALCALRSASNAQDENFRPPGPPYHQGGHDALNLTDQQKQQIRKINLPQAQKTLPLRNELAEKEAHLRSLMSVREPDRAAIDRTVDEVGSLRKELFKAKIANDLKINEVLTEEQRSFRDMRPEGSAQCMPPPGESGPGMR